MVKKIRLIEDQVEDEVLDNEELQGKLYELAKSIDWKLWELLQTIQRVEKKLSVIDSEEAEDEEATE